MSSTSSRKESELLLLNSIKRLYTEYEHIEISTENIQMILENKMNERFFILFITVLIKNEAFYHTLLNNHQRFRQLFNLSIRKPVYLMRLDFIII